MPDTALLRAAAAARESLPVAPAATYARRPPAFANADLVPPADRRVLEARWGKARQDAPAILLHRLGPGRVTPPGVVRLPDGGVIEESLHNLPPARRAGLPAGPAGDAAPAAGAGAALLLARAGSANYGHWLVEHLGALLLLRQAYPAFRPALLVADRRGGAMWQVYADSARLAGLDPGDLLPLGREGLAVPDLALLSPGSAHPFMKHPAALAALAALAPPRPATELLFVRRTSATKRVLHNLDAVEAAASRLGYRTVVPGRMTLAEQIETFAAARIVAGVGGADLTNIAFMPAGGEVVCLLPAVNRNLFFWDICCLRGHRYWSVFGPAVTSRGGGHDDFTVDAGLAAEILARAVSGR